MQLDQVTQLVGASEANAEIGFMARLLALCSLPRTNLGNRKEYIRRNGPYTLGMSAGINNKLPYGNIPRLLLAWVCTEAVRTQNRESLARDEWIARTSDDQIVSNVTACKLALTTRAHGFLTANDGGDFLRAARALSVHVPPIQRVADVSERIEDLSDVPDAPREERRAIRDAARQKNEETPETPWRDHAPAVVLLWCCCGVAVVLLWFYGAGPGHPTAGIHPEVRLD